MDKTIGTIAYRLKTIAQEPRAIGYGLLAIGFILMLVLFPIAGYTATAAEETGTQDKASSALSKSVEAGQAVASRALSSTAVDAGSSKTSVSKVASTKTSTVKAAATKGVGAVAAKVAQNVQKTISSKGGAETSSTSKGTTVGVKDPIVASNTTPLDSKKKLSSREAASAMLVDEIPTVKTLETVKGEVTALGTSEIGLLYRRTETAEYEKRIPLAAKMKFINFKSLKDLGLNDEIEIEYEKTVQYPNEANEKRFMAVKSITLVKKYKPEEAPKEL